MESAALSHVRRLDRQAEPTWRGVVALIGAVLVLRIVYLCFLSTWPLVADEAHYWEWSRRPDWSYYTKGPGVAWVIWLDARSGDVRPARCACQAAIASAAMCARRCRARLLTSRGGNARAAPCTPALALALDARLLRDGAAADD